MIERAHPKRSTRSVGMLLSLLLPLGMMQGGTAVLADARAGDLVELGVVSNVAEAHSAASRVGSPLADLPEHITQVELPRDVENPERPEWSPDGQRLYFLSDHDLWEYTLESERFRNLTENFELPIFRATPLPNGDLLLTAPLSPDGSDWATELWVLQQPVASPVRSPQLLKRPNSRGSVFAGPAVSKHPDSTRIAWATSSWLTVAGGELFDDPSGDVEQFLSRALEAGPDQELRTGRIVYDSSGTPELVDVETVAAGADLGSPMALLEPQGFRSVDDRSGIDNELIFSTFILSHGGGAEIMGVDRGTGEVHNYSRTVHFAEAEGIDPSGGWLLAERTTTVGQVALGVGGPRPVEQVDLWRLSLDGEATWERLVFFNQYRAEKEDPMSGFGSNNGVVNPYGTHFAFTLRGAGEFGHGLALLIFDLVAWEASGQGIERQEPHRLPSTTLMLE